MDLDVVTLRSPTDSAAGSLQRGFERDVDIFAEARDPLAIECRLTGDDSISVKPAHDRSDVIAGLRLHCSAHLLSSEVYWI